MSFPSDLEVKLHYNFSYDGINHFICFLSAYTNDWRSRKGGRNTPAFQPNSDVSCNCKYRCKEF